MKADRNIWWWPLAACPKSSVMNQTKLFDLKIKISRIWALIRLSVADINKNNSVRQSEFKNFIIRQ
jgi:hypothetical protein